MKRTGLSEHFKSIHYIEEAVKHEGKAFLSEALNSKDLDFIKAFFKMANLDLMSGNKLPPNASKLIKQKIPKNFGLNDLYKKLR